MPVNPNGSCLLCRKTQEISKKVADNMRKRILVHTFIYLLILEQGSSLIRKIVPNEEYDLFWFPLLTQFAFSLIAFNMFLFRKKLKFCQRISILLGTLSLYYFINFLCVIFPLCNNTYIILTSTILIGVSYILLLLTIFKKK